MDITATRIDKYGVPQHLFYDGPAPLSFKTFHEWVLFLADNNFTMEDLCGVDFHTEKEFYSMEEFSEILGKCYKSIQLWVKKGKIKSVKFSHKCVLIPRSELERLRRGEVL